MDKLQKIWEYKDLRNKIIVAVGLLAVTRILAHIPMPGVNLAQLQMFFQQNQAFGLLNMFSGGTMKNFSIILMGVGPYITASILFQVLGMVFPALEAMQKEGEAGQQKINQYTRIATVPLALIQAYAMLVLLRSQGILPSFDIFTLITMLITATGGTMFLMWLGEIISEKGIGNGISLIIALGIVSGFPEEIRNTAALAGSGDPKVIMGIAAFVVMFIVTIAGIIFIQEGQRNIPISYAKSSRQGAGGGVSSHLPVRVNIAGVIPIIFAMSLMIIPSVAAKYLEGVRTLWLAHGAKSVETFFANHVYYNIIYFVLVVLFTYFYTSIVFKPEEIAENLQKQSGYIPGIRPGTETKDYLNAVITRITLFGALFLGIIAILPLVVQSVTNITTIALGGTGILIIVSVIVETMRQLQSQLVMHTYDNY
jgi:preprotein translocase subunit SecY